MHLLSLLSLLSITSLAASHPGVPSNFRRVPVNIPVEAFPFVSPSPSLSPSSSASVAPSPTPSTSNDLLRRGSAMVVNYCNWPVYIWSVGSTVRPEVTLHPHERYSETFRMNHSTGGIAIKISTVRDGLYVSAPMTVFAYNLSNNTTVWYDLSDVFGDPFKGYPVRLHPAAPPLYWRDGIPPPESQVRKGNPATDLILTLC